RGASRSLNLIIYESAPAGKLPLMKRVALFYGQRPLNKGSTKVLMFPFAPLCKVLGFQAKQ
ncbi:MAG: hypothetical protein V3R78_10865, partial [Thermodesulfobacteriota bacterium]